MKTDSDPLLPDESSRRLLKRELREVVALAVAVVLIIAAVVFLGHEAERHLQGIETWIAQLGPWGMVAFVVILVLATTVLVPESLFAVVAGALFGLAWGIGLMVIGNLLAAALQYALARRWLHGPIQRALQGRPLLHAIQRAVIRDELRLQLLLRLTPLNPALVSYLLGAAGVRFAGFMLASLLLAAHFSIEVYIGHTGRQLVSAGFAPGQGGWRHEVLIYAGAALGLAAIVLVSRAAHRAVVRAIAESRSDADSEGGTSN